MVKPHHRRVSEVRVLVVVRLQHVEQRSEAGQPPNGRTRAAARACRTATAAAAFTRSFGLVVRFSNTAWISDSPRHALESVAVVDNVTELLHGYTPAFTSTSLSLRVMS